MSRLSEWSDQVRRSGMGRWFYGREQNEQKILLALAALVIISLLWVAVWKPVSDWRALGEARQQRAQQLYDWLRANEVAAKQASRQASRPQQASNSITQVITRAATAHQITVNRLQPEANRVVSVALQQQSFNKIVAWMSQLEENNGVSVERASMDGLDAPGFVNAQIRFN